MMKNLQQIIRQTLILSFNSYRLCSSCTVPYSEFHETECILNENAQFTELNESPYYFEDGLRKVYPYYHTYSFICKSQWINRKILDCFSEESLVYSRKDFKNRIKQGFIKVNDNIVYLDYVLKKSDFISSIIHSHELPVLACPLKVLYEDHDFLVIDKPPSVPVYAGGLYNQNSVVNILANEYKQHELHVVHRLDRLTSGVLVFAKSKRKAKEIRNQMNLCSIKKEYICRVEGNFPDDSVICDKPIKEFYNKIAVCLVHAEGKRSVTEFKKLSYNGKSSVVLCKPHTGRTHQIRVHLQYLGYPIINDPLYNCYVFGHHKGKDGVLNKPIDHLLKDMHKYSSERICNRNFINKTSYENSYSLNFSFFIKYYGMNNTSLKYRKDSSRIAFNKNCYFCNFPNHDPVQDMLGIFLHAYKYEGKDWEFKSDMPLWASKDWQIA